MKTIIKLAASGLYVGYVPFASGTFGSLLGVGIFLLLRGYPVFYLFACILLLVLGFLVCGKAEGMFGEKDSRKIVIDEIASICLVYLFIKPSVIMLILGFLFFRLFDIIKPPPAKKIESMAGSAGVMLDDIIAAAYTIIVLSVVSSIFPLI